MVDTSLQCVKTLATDVGGRRWRVEWPHSLLGRKKMDRDTVYIKTPEGEEAVRQRTRLVQRNLRNILIMVDGRASVADLAKRFGNENATQAALTELLDSRLIVETFPAGAASHSQPPEPVADEVPLMTSEIPPQPGSPIVPPTEPQAPVIEEIVLSAPEYESIPPPLAKPAKAPDAKAEGPGWLDRIKALLPKGKPSAKQARNDEYAVAPTAFEADLKPLRGGSRLALSWPLLILGGLVGLLVILALAAALFPFGRYLPGIEQKLSAALKDPVRIGEIGFAFLPSPHIALGNISVGKGGHMTVGKARVMPEFLSLTGQTTVVRDVVLERVQVKAEALGRLAGAGGAPGLDIRVLRLNDLSLTVAGHTFGGFGGEVEMSGAPGKIQLKNSDGTLRLELQPGKEGYRLVATAYAWVLPTKPALKFDFLEAQGELKPGGLELGKLEGRTLDGIVAGSLLLEWARDTRLKWDADMKRLSLTKVLSALESEFGGGGEVSGRLLLEGQAESFARLSNALKAQATFEVRRGSIGGFDLGEAARNTSRTPTRGGVTRFEQLSGSLRTDAQGARLGDLRLTSGLFKASGAMNITPEKQLSGNVEIELKSSATTIRVPLIVGGTAKEPLLTPARGAASVRPSEAKRAPRRPFAFPLPPLLDDGGNGVGDVVDVARVQRGEADASGADGVDAELGFQPFDLLGREPGVGEHATLIRHEGEVLRHAARLELLHQPGAHGADAVAHAGEFLFPLLAQPWA